MVEIETKLKEQFEESIKDSPEPEKSYCRQKVEERLGGFEAKREIMRVLVGEVKELGKFIGSKMINRSIPLEYINPFPKN